MEQMNDTWHPENFRQPHSRKERGNIATKGYTITMSRSYHHHNAFNIS